MSMLETIRRRASAARKHIVLPEGEDDRTIHAAGLCHAQRLPRLTLLRSAGEHRRRAGAAREPPARRGVYPQSRRGRRGGGGAGGEGAGRRGGEPLYFGDLMVRA